VTTKQGFVVPAGGGKRFDMGAPGRFAEVKLVGHETNESIMMFEETLPAGTPPFLNSSAFSVSPSAIRERRRSPTNSERPAVSNLPHKLLQTRLQRILQPRRGVGIDQLDEGGNPGEAGRGEDQIVRRPEGRQAERDRRER
jgi:hypothetical protein